MWDQNVALNITPIMEDGSVLSPETLRAYVERMLKSSGSKEEMLEWDKRNAGLLISVEDGIEDLDKARDKASEFAMVLHEIHAEMYPEEEEFGGDVLSEAAKKADALVMKNTGYAEQLKEILGALEGNDVEGLVDIFETMKDNDILDEFIKKYPELTE